MEKRKSNFEMLRIVAMLMIVAFHAFSQIGYYDETTHIYKMVKQSANMSVNILGLSILGSWGLEGVGCFFLISAFFLQKRNGFSAKKAIKVISMTLFWEITVLLVAIKFKSIPVGMDFGMKMLIKSILSLFSREYWFISAYLFMYILSPFMNGIIENLNNEVYKRFVFVLTIIVPIYYMVTECTTTVCDLVLAIYYYLVWGYLKRNENNVIERHAKIIWGGVKQLLL